jgi:hypothetical protein
MDKFNEILKYLVDREQILAQQIVTNAKSNQITETVMSNIAHEEIKKLLNVCAELLQEDVPKKPLLRIVK